MRFLSLPKIILFFAAILSAIIPAAYIPAASGSPIPVNAITGAALDMLSDTETRSDDPVSIRVALS